VRATGGNLSVREEDGGSSARSATHEGLTTEGLMTEGLMAEGLMAEGEGGQGDSTQVRAADSCLSVREGRRPSQRKERRNRRRDG
jgi:hypothetical protein